MTDAAAAMVTTRERIVMAAWYLIENADLRADPLAGDEDRHFTILTEILCLEPIASLLRRRSDPSAGPPALYAIDPRAIHVGEEGIGPCPHALDPARAQPNNAIGAFVSLGAGANPCPGKLVALHASRMFLDALLRVPGIRLERAPDVGWSEIPMSDEPRDAIVACDRA